MLFFSDLKNIYIVGVNYITNGSSHCYHSISSNVEQNVCCYGPFHYNTQYKIWIQIKSYKVPRLEAIRLEVVSISFCIFLLIQTISVMLLDSSLGSTQYLGNRRNPYRDGASYCMEILGCATSLSAILLYKAFCS